MGSFGRLTQFASRWAGLRSRSVSDLRSCRQTPFRGFSRSDLTRWRRRWIGVAGGCGAAKAPASQDRPSTLASNWLARVDVMGEANGWL
jgi:hypothetical protein